MTKLTPAQSKELLKDTPMHTESYHETREREEAHRALPDERQPWMVCYFGMLDYGVLWIGPEAGTEEQAESEAQWWRDRIGEGLELLPFDRRPLAHQVMVRQQWDLDALVKAIRETR